MMMLDDWQSSCIHIVINLQKFVTENAFLQIDNMSFLVTHFDIVFDRVINSGKSMRNEDQAVCEVFSLVEPEDDPLVAGHGKGVHEFHPHYDTGQPSLRKLVCKFSKNTKVKMLSMALGGQRQLMKNPT